MSIVLKCACYELMVVYREMFIFHMKRFHLRDRSLQGLGDISHSHERRGVKSPVYAVAYSSILFITIWSCG
jgi:hypothetical protein